MASSNEGYQIPPELPEFMLGFTKDVLRDQPEDIIEYATKYFTAMVKGEIVPPQAKPKILSQEILTGLHPLMSERGSLNRMEIELMWKYLEMPLDSLNHILLKGKFGDTIEWKNFLPSCCNYLGKTVKDSLILACYILNSDLNCKYPDACVSYETLKFLFTYLAAENGNLTQKQIVKALEHFQKMANSNNGVVKVSDFVNNRKLRLDPPTKK